MSMDIYLTDHRPHPAGMGGTQKRYRFPNGWQASVVSYPYSYGGEQGLWELAVLNRHGVLDYSTPVTSDVLGWLSDADAEAALIQIAALPACPEDCLTPEQDAQQRDERWAALMQDLEVKE